MPPRSSRIERYTIATLARDGKAFKPIKFNATRSLRIVCKTRPKHNTQPIDTPTTICAFIRQTHGVHTPSARPLGRENTSISTAPIATKPPGNTAPINTAPNTPSNAPTTNTPHTWYIPFK